MTVLLGRDGYVPHAPTHGNTHTYPWQSAIQALP